MSRLMVTVSPVPPLLPPLKAVEPPLTLALTVLPVEAAVSVPVPVAPELSIKRTVRLGGLMTSTPVAPA